MQTTTHTAITFEALDITAWDEPLDEIEELDLEDLEEPDTSVDFVLPEFRTDSTGWDRARAWVHRVSSR